MFDAVPFDGEKPAEGLAAAYVPFVPPMVKMITCSSNKPPLLSEEEGGIEAAPFEIDKMPFRFVPYVTFKEVGGEWSIETPLALCHYVKPPKERMYDVGACTEAAIANAKRERHNKFVVDALRMFMKRNDCGTSAGMMTMPPPPEDLVVARLEAIKKLTSDKLGTAKQAIEYCARYEVYCGRDFEFDKALEKANDVCFEQTIKARTGEGKRVRVRLEGRRPAWWDGIGEKDSSGKAVAWKRGEGHTFLTPNVLVAEAPCADLVPALADASATAQAPSEEKVNPFDDLFKPLPLALPAPEEQTQNGPLIEDLIE